MTKGDRKRLALVPTIFGAVLIALGIFIKVADNDDLGFEAIAMGSMAIVFGVFFWVRYFKEQP